MNSLEKHLENEEHRKAFPEDKKKQTSIYYLHRKLREKDIAYTARAKIVFPTPIQTEDKHIKKLLKEHQYTVQTIIQ
jgi:hypothetical protein